MKKKLDPKDMAVKVEEVNKKIEEVKDALLNSEDIRNIYKLILENEKTVIEAKNAYDSLNEEEKELVPKTNADVLQRAIKLLGDAKLSPQERYAKHNLDTRVCRFNVNTDKDITDWLDKNCDNYQGYIKKLIRNDIKNQTTKGGA